MRSEALDIFKYLLYEYLRPWGRIKQIVQNQENAQQSRMEGLNLPWVDRVLILLLMAASPRSQL